MSLGEFDVIDRFFTRSSPHSSVIESVGDDCAILPFRENSELVISMDTMVSGRHFHENISPRNLATRSFCAALSDLAAMGATPDCFTLGLTMPELNEIWLKEFSESLHQIANKFECDLVGGDTTHGPLAITIQVHGWVEKQKALLRSNAKVGDRLFVSEVLGDGAAALALIQNPTLKKILNERESHYLYQRFYRPEPQIALGKILSNYAHAAIDISDGLIADAKHIAKKSRVDIEIDLEKIPLSEAAKKIANDNIEAYALSGGDDYQLLFGVSESKISSLQKELDKNKLSVVEIGRVCELKQALPEVRVLKNNQLIKMDKLGYEHFIT
jgi:thiamine-monophosphate kinase